MPLIETEYQGHRIIYNDNTDQWTCRDLDVADAALSKVKDKIGKMLKATRKAEAVSVLLLSDSVAHAAPAVRLTEATLVEYLGPNMERDYHHSRPAQTRQKGHKVAAMYRRSANDRASRQTAKLTDFVPDTPEAHAAVKVAQDAAAAIAAAITTYRDAVAAIPRVTPNDIAGLIAISGLPVSQPEMSDR